MEPQERLKLLHEEIRALEERSGITIAMEKAREGRFMPIGASGERATPAEYFADEHDHFREGARNAYFSTQDLDLRKELIAKQCEIEQEAMRSLEADVVAAQQIVHKAKAKAQQEPWSTAAIVAIGAVAIGGWRFGVTGAIAGAVGGFFIGQGIVSASKREAAAEVEQELQSLQMAEQSLAEQKLWPPCFSLNEELTGDREHRLDRESAYGNVRRAATNKP